MAVDDLIRAGKVRHAAASGPTADQLIEARVIAAQSEISDCIKLVIKFNRIVGLFF